MNATNDFTTKQKIIIAFRFFGEVMRDSLCKNKEHRSFISRTRGNVTQRMGGKISTEEHDKYVEEASEKTKYL
jgi:hypothetical protein